MFKKIVLLCCFLSLVIWSDVADAGLFSKDNKDRSFTVGLSIGYINWSEHSINFVESWNDNVPSCEDAS